MSKIGPFCVYSSKTLTLSITYSRSFFGCNSERQSRVLQKVLLLEMVKKGNIFRGANKQIKTAPKSSSMLAMFAIDPAVYWFMQLSVTPYQDWLISFFLIFYMKLFYIIDFLKLVPHNCSLDFT